MTIKASPIKQHSFCSFISSNCSSIACNGYSKITVIHDKIFDIFSLYFGKRIPKTILTHGSGTFIAERFLFESVKPVMDIQRISHLDYFLKQHTSYKEEGTYHMC
jgi:hypothetical protein